jgi:hypothetical protein
LQAALSEPFGLRAFLAVTTDHRGYYDSLPARPLQEGDDPAIAIAQSAKERAEREPFRSVLSEALEATARIAEVVKPFAAENSLWRTVRSRHRSGLLLPNVAGTSTCADCAWAVAGESALECRQTERGEQAGAWVLEDDPACERFALRFDEAECGRCGACCREGFDLVPVEALDRVLVRHPELVGQSSLGPSLLRPGGRCVALDGGTEGTPYRCRIYADRPTSCQDFEVRGSACLVARRRVGLSR